MTRSTPTAPRDPGCATASSSVNAKLNALVHDEDVDLVTNVQAGLATRGDSPGPLSAREAAVAWFADRIRADLAGDEIVESEPAAAA